ncbi:MAG: winged helix-turn-helix domain-containing protein [Thermoanaerobaculia bacterium]|nr:winged helix-turn-helix domain-containing protein [Thermoanaerobaculia bacterium]
MDRRFRCDDRTEEFWVGRFSVRPDEGLIIDGSHSVRIEPQVMALLAYLADNPGRVVSREELLREVWNGAVVTDGAITRCVAVIRRTLDARQSGDPIRTVPKRGYQWIGSEKPISSSLSNTRSPRVRRAAWAAALLLTIMATGIGVWRLEPSEQPVVVAVEGFLDLDEMAEREQWGRSVTEELIAGLHASTDLTVVTGSPDVPAPVVVLTGSVRREGTFARVFSQLTDTRTQEVISARTCTIPATPRLEIQEQWAGTIVQGIEAQLN